MSQEIRHAALKEKTKTLLEGPLKHIRGAALAAALLPLASIAAAPASAQTVCDYSAGTCTISGVVWNDTNMNGMQDAGETGIEGAKVYLFDGHDTIEAETGPDGVYYFTVPYGSYQIFVSLSGDGVLGGMQLSLTDQGGNDALDSDGTLDSSKLYSTAHIDVAGSNTPNTDFGFFKPTLQAPGTGTPGYWKNHPEAWPVGSITVGSTDPHRYTYTKDQAITLLGKVGKDKTLTMFSSLVSAMLNLLAGNPGACLIQNQNGNQIDVVAIANAWMGKYGPPGSGVSASSPAWAEGEPIHKYLDAYNNGQLCDPHRN